MYGILESENLLTLSLTCEDIGVAMVTNIRICCYTIFLFFIRILTFWNRKYKYYCLYFSSITLYPSFIPFLWQAFCDRWHFNSVANYRPHLSHFWTIIYYYFYELTIFRLNEEHFTCHLSTNILVRLLTVNTKNESQKMRYPILVTVLKMRPRYSQSTRENPTPTSGTSPWASYKQVTR